MRTIEEKKYVAGRALDGTPVRYPLELIEHLDKLKEERKRQKLQEVYDGHTPMEEFDF